MTKQQLARRRNWSKARLLGMRHYDWNVFSEREKFLLEGILNTIDEIMEGWDEESKKLGLTPRNKNKDEYQDKN